jgi:hypothetical protein
MSDGENSGNSPTFPVPQKQNPENIAEVIQQKAPEILDSIPADQRERLAAIRRWK